MNAVHVGYISGKDDVLGYKCYDTFVKPPPLPPFLLCANSLTDSTTSTYDEPFLVPAPEPEETPNDRPAPKPEFNTSPSIKETVGIPRSTLPLHTPDNTYTVPLSTQYIPAEPNTTNYTGVNTRSTSTSPSITPTTNSSLPYQLPKTTKRTATITQPRKRCQRLTCRQFFQRLSSTPSTRRVTATSRVTMATTTNSSVPLHLPKPNPKLPYLDIFGRWSPL